MGAQKYQADPSWLAEIASPKRKVGWSTERDGSRSDDRETLQNRLSVECRSIITTSMLTNFERRTGNSLSDLPMKVFSSKKSGVLVSSGLELRQKLKSHFQEQASLYDKIHCTLKAYWKVGQWTLKVLGGSDFVKSILHCTFQDIVEHLQAESFTEDIFEGYDNTKAFRWIAVLNEFWPKGNLDYANLWKGDTVPQLPARSWSKVTKEQLDGVLLYAPGKKKV